MAELSSAQIHDATKAELLTHGAGEWQSEEVAKATAHSEMRGNVICGLQYVESYCLQLASGRVDGTVEPEVSRPRAAAILSDAHSFSDQFEARLMRLAEAVAHEETARLPGQKRRPAERVEVADALWDRIVTPGQAP